MPWRIRRWSSRMDGQGVWRRRVETRFASSTPNIGTAERAGSFLDRPFPHAPKRQKYYPRASGWLIVSCRIRWWWIECNLKCCFRLHPPATRSAAASQVWRSLKRCTSHPARVVSAPATFGGGLGPAAKSPAANQGSHRGNPTSLFLTIMLPHHCKCGHPLFARNKAIVTMTLGGWELPAVFIHKDSDW